MGHHASGSWHRRRAPPCCFQGCGAYAFDSAMPLDVRVSIDCHCHGLARPHMSHLGFLGIALNPGVIGGNQVEGSDRGGQILAGRD
jgi:hypothetical protein